MANDRLWIVCPCGKSLLLARCVQEIDWVISGEGLKVFLMEHFLHGNSNAGFEFEHFTVTNESRDDEYP